MKDYATNTLYMIIIFQLLFFCAFLLFTPKNKRQNRLLGLFLISQAFGVFHLYSENIAQDLISITPHLLYIGKPFILMYGPALYLYVKSITNPEQITKRQFIHFLPFFIFLVYLSITFYLKPAGIKQDIYSSGEIINIIHQPLLHLFTKIQIILYVLACLRLIHHYQIELKENYSSTKSQSLAWLKSFIYFYIIASILSFTLSLHLSIVPSLHHYVYFLMLIAFFLFFNFIVYNALIHPEIFHISVSGKYQGSTLSRETRARYSDKVKQYMISHKPYLNSNLKIDDLARELSMPSWHLSQVLNQEFKQSFFDFINSYRINEAKQLLTSSGQSGQTILEILYQVGFNTKASFNKAFKKHVGITPSDYKKGQLL